MSAALFVAAGLLGAAALVVAGLLLFTAWTARRVRAAVPPNGRFVDVGGARIHYTDEGAGPALLFVHGLGGQARHFTHSLAARLAGEFRVVVMDRPGSGHSTRAPGAAAGPRAQAETVAAFARALGLQDVVLVGHSLGGAVALAVAVGHPELVRGLALVSPYAQAADAPPPVFARLAIGSPLVRGLVAWTVATPAAVLRSRRVLHEVFAPDAVPADYATAGGGLLTLRPGAFQATSADLVAVNADMPALAAGYASLRMPVGVLFGTGDPILDSRAQIAALEGRVADLEVELVEGGHMLPLTRPDQVAEFVRGVARRAGVTC